MKYLTFVLLLGGLLACGLPSVTFMTPTPIVAPSPTVTPMVTPTPTVTPIPVDGEAEYYRGAYDLCLKALGDREKCAGIIQALYDSGWYTMPSNGWRWPLALAAMPEPVGSTL